MRLCADEVRAVSVVRTGAVGLLLCHAMACVAGSSSQSLILDTQQGIHDGKGGLLLQTAPLSREPIVEPAQPRAPTGQAASNPSIPVFVTPYFNIPGSGAPTSGQPPSSSRSRPRQP